MEKKTKDGGDEGVIWGRWVFIHYSGGIWCSVGMVKVYMLQF